MAISREFEAWAVQAAPYFAQGLGLSPSFAIDVARLYVLAWSKGLSPRFTRGFSSPQHQAELRARWDRGDRQGLRVRPADPSTSKHCRVVAGRPAALAVDMPTANDTATARLASDLGIGAGELFKDKDQGHYYSLRSST